MAVYKWAMVNTLMIPVTSLFQITFHCPKNTVNSLLDIIYPNIHLSGHSDQYFSEHIILSSMNNKVNEFNKIVLTKFPALLSFSLVLTLF